MTWADLREALACKHRRGREHQDYDWPFFYEFSCIDCAFWFDSTVVSKRSNQDLWADWLIDMWVEQGA